MCTYPGIIKNAAWLVSGCWPYESLTYHCYWSTPPRFSRFFQHNMGYCWFYLQTTYKNSTTLKNHWGTSVWTLWKWYSNYSHWVLCTVQWDTWSCRAKLRVLWFRPFSMVSRIWITIIEDCQCLKPVGILQQMFFYLVDIFEKNDLHKSVKTMAVNPFITCIEYNVL